MKTFKYLLFSLFLYSSFISISAQDITIDKRTVYLDSISNNPSGMIYFFDGREISERDMYEKGMNGELENSTGVTWIGKDAILRFGERYRYGVLFWESNNTRKNAED